MEETNPTNPPKPAVRILDTYYNVEFYEIERGKKHLLFHEIVIGNITHGIFVAEVVKTIYNANNEKREVDKPITANGLQYHYHWNIVDRSENIKLRKLPVDEHPELYL